MLHVGYDERASDGERPSYRMLVILQVGLDMRRTCYEAQDHGQHLRMLASVDLHWGHEEKLMAYYDFGCVDGRGGNLFGQMSTGIGTHESIRIV